MNNKNIGAIFASAVAGLLVSTSLYANPDETKPAEGKAAEAKPYCLNNTCKGKSACSGHGNESCSGQNTCKGKGWLEAADAKACKKAGGTWKKA